MKSLSLIFLFSSVLYNCTQPITEVSEKDVLGIWDCVSGCMYEQYEFTINADNHEFYIYSGQRMYNSGNWQLDKNHILLIYETGDSALFSVESRNDSLIFGGGEMIFIPFLPDTADEMEIMDNPLSGIFEYDFTVAEPTVFEWNKINEVSSVETFSISGWKVSTAIELENDFTPLMDILNRFSQHLRELGYIDDVYNANEIISGFINDEKVVLILTHVENDEPVGEVLIEVFYGVLQI